MPEAALSRPLSTRRDLHGPPAGRSDASMAMFEREEQAPYPGKCMNRLVTCRR